MKKFILKHLAIILIKYLQRKYKNLSIKNQYNQTNQIIDKLILIQSILYFLKNQFKALGYFSPSPIWSNKKQQEFDKLFPVKNFKELDIVISYNPEAVTYYKNQIFKYNQNVQYSAEIKKHLKEWLKWN